MNEINNNEFDGFPQESASRHDRLKHDNGNRKSGLEDGPPMYEVFIKRRFFIIAMTALGFLIALILGMLSPKIYQARASFFALEGSRWNRDNGGTVFPVSNSMGSFITETTSMKKDIARQLLLIIYSRSLAKLVVDELPELSDHFWPGADKNHPLYKERLAAMVRGAIMVDLTNHTKPPVMVCNMTNPDLAVATANKYLEVLRKYIESNSLNQESKNRQYLEKQSKLYEASLEKTEEDLRKFEVKHKLISLDTQAKSALNVIQSLKSQLIVKSRELEILENSPTSPKDEIRRLRRELDSIKSEISFQENGNIDNLNVNEKHRYTEIIDGGVSAVPNLAAEHSKLRRIKENMEKIHSMLVEKLELAKLKEQMEPTSFYVLDPAVTAMQIAPNVRLQSIYGAIVGLFLACGYLLVTTLINPVTNKS